MKRYDLRYKRQTPRGAYVVEPLHQGDGYRPEFLLRPSKVRLISARWDDPGDRPMRQIGTFEIPDDIAQMEKLTEADLAPHESAAK